MISHATISTTYFITLFKYSSTGTIDGIEGHVDLNIAYKNYPEIIKNIGTLTLHIVLKINDIK